MSRAPRFPYVDLSNATDDQVADWLSKSRPGEWMCYYRGWALANSNRGMRLLALADTVIDQRIGNRGAGTLHLMQFKISGGSHSPGLPSRMGDYLYLACRKYPEKAK